MKTSLNKAFALKEAAEERIRTGETPLFLVNTGDGNQISVKSVDELYRGLSAENGKVTIQMAIVHDGAIEEKYELAYEGDVSILRNWMSNKFNYQPTFDVQRVIWPGWGEITFSIFETEGARNNIREFLGEFEKLVDDIYSLMDDNYSVKTLPYFLGVVFNKAPKPQPA